MSHNYDYRQLITVPMKVVCGKYAIVLGLVLFLPLCKLFPREYRITRFPYLNIITSFSFEITVQQTCLLMHETKNCCIVICVFRNHVRSTNFITSSIILRCKFHKLSHSGFRFEGTFLLHILIDQSFWF